MNPKIDSRSRTIRSVVFWIGLGMALGVWILATQGPTAAAEYYSAYFLEKSLSVDNIFVFAIIFSELHVPAEYQRRMLRFGASRGRALDRRVFSESITRRAHRDQEVQIRRRAARGALRTATLVAVPAIGEVPDGMASKTRRNSVGSRFVHSRSSMPTKNSFR